MKFGEALRHEIIQIPKLDKKVFPVVAPSKIGQPFLVYQREEMDFKKVMAGTTDKATAVFILTLVAKDYPEKEEVEEEVRLKLLSFLGRSIGDGGPLIQNVTVKYLPEGYDLQVDAITSKIRLEVNY